MTIDEFTETLEKLENFYNPKEKMTDEQKRIWFENLKTMSIERFKYITANLYKTSKFMPKLADVFELNTTIGNIEKKPNNNKEFCKKCNNTGYIIYKQVLQNGNRNIVYDYGAICDCNRKKQYKGWEITDERYKSNYYTPLATELGL